MALYAVIVLDVEAMLHVTCTSSACPVPKFKPDVVDPTQAPNIAPLDPWSLTQPDPLTAVILATVNVKSSIQPSPEAPLIRVGAKLPIVTPPSTTVNVIVGNPLVPYNPDILIR